MAFGCNSDPIAEPSLGGGNVPTISAGDGGKFVKVKTDETGYELATIPGGGDLLSTNNLSELTNLTDARTNLGLGDSATKNVGTITGTVSAGDHDHSGVYEPAFTKNSAFNVNFAGSGAASTVSRSDHDHSGTYEPAFSKSTAFNKDFSGSGAATTVSRSDHDHSGVYEPAFSKNSAFNVNFSGSGAATTVSRSDHDHSGIYEPAFSHNTAFNKNFGTAAGTVSEGNHTHDALYPPLLELSRTTTDGTANVELWVNGTTNTRLTMADNSTWYFKISVVGRRTDADAENYLSVIEGLIVRNGSAATIHIVDSNAFTMNEGSVPWTVSVQADVTNGALVVYVTGEAAKTIQWKATAQLTESNE